MENQTSFHCSFRALYKLARLNKASWPHTGFLSAEAHLPDTLWATVSTSRVSVLVLSVFITIPHGAQLNSALSESVVW